MTKLAILAIYWLWGCWERALQLTILIKELGTLQTLTVSATLSQLLGHPDVRMVLVKPQDLRIRNLTFAQAIYEMTVADFRLLASLADIYQKMDKGLEYYARKYSPALVAGVVGTLNNFFLGDGLPLERDFDPSKVRDIQLNDLDLQGLPKRVLARLRHYFNEPFIVENIRLSDEKHANAKLLDDTAEFRILFTVLDVAMPDEQGIYQLQPLHCDIFGRYDAQIYFDFEHIKTDKSKFFGYDDGIYDKRQAYLQMIFDACQDRDGKPLRQALEAVAQTFIYDFWLE